MSYRNGFYQGQLRAGRKHGRGVLITDAGEIIVGQWKSDQLFGNAFVWIKCDEYAFMDFNRGELEGHCYHRAGEQMLLIEFNGNRPIGKQLLANFEEKRVQIVSYRSN